MGLFTNAGKSQQKKLRVRFAWMKYGCPGISFLLLLLLSGCQKDAGHASGAADVIVTANGSVNNLLEDGSLNSLQSWPVKASAGGVIHTEKSGTVFSANAAGQYYIYQRVLVQAKKFYKVSVTVNYTINNYSPAGIYAMDSSMAQTIGEFEQVYSSGTGETWEFVFYSKTSGPVSVVMGFLNGINGNATFSNAALAEYDYHPRIAAAGLSAYLGRKLQLLFTAGKYDTAISKLSDYVNSVLLCRYAYYADTVEQPILDSLVGSDTSYAYFNEYRHTPDSITDSYCQKSSLSLGEILTNAFNIPVRQIYMVIGGVGLHQFQEYWNPFAGKWIIIDPCFNTRYEKDGILVGADEITQSTAPGYIVRFGQYYYYQATDELVLLWQELEVLDVKDYYTITFPFS